MTGAQGSSARFWRGASTGQGMAFGKLTPVEVLMALGVPLLWGLGFVFAKAAIGHFPPILLMAFRFLLTAAVLVWFVRPPWEWLPRIFLIAIVSAAIQYSLTFTGLAGLDASIAVLVVQLEVPILVLLGVLFLGERPEARKWAGIAVAFIGVALIAGEPKLAGAWFSLLLVVGGAFTWACGQAAVRTLKGLDGLTVTAWVAVCATPQLFVMSAIFESGQIEAIRSADWVVWGAVIYLGLAMTALGYWLWNTLIRRHPLKSVGPFLLLMPVCSVIGAAVFLGERLTIRTGLGGLVVLCGVAIIMVERRSRAAS